MKITLAYPIDGLGDPDETVEVDETTGRQLIGDGYARPASPDAGVEASASHRHKARSPRKPPASGTPETEHEGGQ